MPKFKGKDASLTSSGPQGHGLGGVMLCTHAMDLSLLMLTGACRGLPGLTRPPSRFSVPRRQSRFSACKLEG